MASPLRHMRRREFLKESARSTALIALSGAVAIASDRLMGARADAAPNPFAYDLSGYDKTDPGLLQYEQVRRFRIANPEPRRIALGAEGHLYLATRKGVSIVDREGGPVGEIAFSSAVRCVAVARQGIIYAGL